MKSNDKFERNEKKHRLLQGWITKYFTTLILIAESMLKRACLLGKTAEDFVTELYIVLYKLEYTELLKVKKPFYFLKKTLKNHILNGKNRKNLDLDKRARLRELVTDKHAVNSGVFKLYNEDSVRLLKEHLTEEQFEAILLVAEGHSYEEAAALLDIKKATFGSRVYQGRKKAKEVFEANEMLFEPYKN